MSSGAAPQMAPDAYPAAGNVQRSGGSGLGRSDIHVGAGGKCDAHAGERCHCDACCASLGGAE